MILTEEREKRFKEVIARRQRDLTIILENVHDPHNIGAVLRTCDAVGIHEIYVLYTEERLRKLKVKEGKSASGASKWVKVNYFESRELCFQQIRAKYKNIYATHLSKESVSLHELNLNSSVALLFGNEHDGISQDSLNLCDGNYIIPMYGMVQSLNISVACAVSIYEALRQRDSNDKYKREFDEEKVEHSSQFQEWYNRQLNR